ncbi:MAG: hypothetical protein WC159_01030 [Sphaerochaetaceae bacterium]
MKKLSSLLIMLLILFPAIADDAVSHSAEAKVVSSVSGYLLHGFLTKADNSLRDTTTIDNALGENGVDLNYTIKTNQSCNLMVGAVITPFKQETDSGDNAASILIDSVSVNGVLVTPKYDNRYDFQAFTFDTTTTAMAVDQENHYELIDFSSEIGKTQYDYVIHITANKYQVEQAPAGHYVSSVALSLTYKD